MPRWLKRLPRPRRDHVSPAAEVTPGQQEANAALGRATRALREAEQQAPETTQASGFLREIRERNHFAESLELIFRGGGARWDGHS